LVGHSESAGLNRHVVGDGGRQHDTDSRYCHHPVDPGSTTPFVCWD
jgi:hypothetical protein